MCRLTRHWLLSCVAFPPRRGWRASGICSGRLAAADRAAAMLEALALFGAVVLVGLVALMWRVLRWLLAFFFGVGVFVAVAVLVLFPP